jgi:hypothetical protein
LLRFFRLVLGKPWVINNLLNTLFLVSREELNRGLFGQSALLLLGRILVFGSLGLSRSVLHELILLYCGYNPFGNTGCGPRNFSEVFRIQLWV